MKKNEHQNTSVGSMKAAYIMQFMEKSSVTESTQQMFRMTDPYNHLPYFSVWKGNKEGKKKIK